MSGSSSYRNVAKGKPATQSSLSRWSTKLGAGEAVSGVIPANFAIHTEMELNPWWMVDLEHIYPIDLIVVHNRLDMLPERAKTCKVEISKDGLTWLLIHKGIVHFLGGKKGKPLALPLRCQEFARYVRISLDANDALHLSQVEVFADSSPIFKEKYGLAAMRFRPPLSPHFDIYSYIIENDPGDGSIIGLKLTEIGRMGNQILQLINAIGFARRLSLRYIKVFNLGIFKLTEAFSHEGINFIPERADAGERGGFLTGNFFFPEYLSPVIDDVAPQEQHQIVHDIIYPRLMEKLPIEADEKFENELAIHIRAGDIFRAGSVHEGYAQPPLAFYTLVIRFCLEQKLITCVRVVYEDKGNPCVDALIEFLSKERIPFRTQSASLHEDLAALIDSKYLVVGFGTFGIGASLLSKTIGTVFYFADLYHKKYNSEYKSIASVENVIFIRDRERKYIKLGQWRNTPEQLSLMVEYPESSLEIMEEHYIPTS